MGRLNGERSTHVSTAFFTPAMIPAICCTGLRTLFCPVRETFCRQARAPFTVAPPPAPRPRCPRTILRRVHRLVHDAIHTSPLRLRALVRVLPRTVQLIRRRAEFVH